MGLAEKSFNNGEIIVREGESGRSFFKILEGRAYVFSDFEKKENWSGCKR